MRASTPRFIALALLVALGATATGCAAKKNTTGATGPTSTTTATVKPATAGSTIPTVAPAPKPATAGRGKITSPAGGSAVRSAILTAAMSGLHLTGGVAVSQLFMQDGAAVGDLRPTSGKRVFFALTGGPSHWKLAWSALFGSAQANATTLTEVDPEAFSDLAHALDFNKALAVSSGTGTGPGPTLMCFEGFARKSAKDLAGATYKGQFTIQAKIAKDSSGTWWGNAIAEPSEPGLESIGVWGRWNGTDWKGEIADFSTEGADAGYFPADVLAKLAL